jgi:Tat protein translocase TatB subunit
VFGIGMQELVLIFVIALIVVGPKQLPELAKALGKGYAEFRRAFDDMKTSVEREIRADEIRRTLADLPPPPAPPPGAPPGGPQPAAPSPYPEIVDGTPPAPEPPAAPPAGPAAGAAGQDRGRA